MVAIVMVAGVGCGSPLTDDGTTGAGLTSDDTTRRTVREEVSTTVSPESRTTRANGPLPDPDWVDTNFELVAVATLDAPIAMATRTGGDDLWLAERSGRVRHIERRVSSNFRREELKVVDEPVLDITDRVTTEGEGGLLGVDFSLNGRLLYVSYTDSGGDTVVSEFRMDDDRADPDSERILLTVDQPYSNHNGGQITIGPDGFLYVGLGDGGSGGDPDDNGQNLETLLGSILRIDPFADGDDPYSVPGSNPYVDQRNVPDEIWLYGVRNPWRFSFDQVTGDLWVADVGQNEVEEVTFLSAGQGLAGRGANLGWRTMEGDNVFDDRGMDDPTLAMADYVGPVHTYAHTQGRCSITGGYVYRGPRIAALKGVYLYTDFCTGEMFGLRMLDDGRALWAPVNTDRNLEAPISFGEGPDGELYVLELNGAVVRIQHQGWRMSTRLLEPGDGFLLPDQTVDVIPGDGSEERFDQPEREAPPPVFPGREDGEDERDELDQLGDEGGAGDG